MASIVNVEERAVSSSQLCTTDAGASFLVLVLVFCADRTSCASASKTNTTHAFIVSFLLSVCVGAICSQMWMLPARQSCEQSCKHIRRDIPKVETKSWNCRCYKFGVSNSCLGPHTHVGLDKMGTRGQKVYTVDVGNGRERRAFHPIVFSTT